MPIIILIITLFGIQIELNASDTRALDTIKQVYVETKDWQVTIAIINASQKYNIPITVACALAFAESEYDKNAVSYNRTSRDYGLFQLNSKTYSNFPSSFLLDVHANADLAMGHLQWLLKMYKGDLRKAIYGYNAGCYAVTTNDIPEITIAHYHHIFNKIVELESKWKKS